ncbi:alpha/beta fold hydrolase [Maribellus comscasis]|uniref:Alpha/beta fold hydrolase n=2 Tax=Maribellus comscasis TaxID=2681766 RepID=A0A6I6K927_9BACT|nr:alpha/beta fold hydrolase [Maribellus comscasis]
MKKFNHEVDTYFNIEDAKIYYEIRGREDKPVLLFLHGGFGTIEDFNDITDSLSNEFTLVGVDSRGHGKSTLGSAQLTYEQIQKDVEQLLRHLKIDTLSIIGFSDGGIVTYRLAALSSLNIEKLVTVGAEWHVRSLESVKGIFAKITSESWKEKFPGSYNSYQRLNPEPDFELFTQRILSMWLDESPTGFPNEAVQHISCPMLFVRGENDHLVSEKSLTELSEIVSDSRFVNIPGAGHVVFQDEKEKFIKHLDEFL